MKYKYFYLHFSRNLLLSFCFFLFALNMVWSQNTNRFQVHGTVKDNNGFLAGVSVSEKGASSTVTDENGRFSLTVSGPDAILVFNYVGYKTLEKSVAQSHELHVILEQGNNELSSVVVTALGIARERRSLAYSISEVKSEDLVKAANPNLLKSLDGKVSGVNLVSLSSDPTSSVLVNIRGTTSMPSKSSGADVSARSQPLYVIDGIPVGTQSFTPKDGVDFGNILSQLNPEDIDNITILKGGSAGALYGAEGGNGVVMITTKSGRGAKKRIGRFLFHIRCMGSTVSIYSGTNDLWAGGAWL